MREKVQSLPPLTAMYQSPIPLNSSHTTNAFSPPQITTSLTPTYLKIHNDSALHSHHQSMKGVTSKETHFRVVITSEKFEGKMQAARHRMVYALLKEEMAREEGIHALQLKTRTQAEEERERVKEEGKGEGA